LGVLLAALTQARGAEPLAPAPLPAAAPLPAPASAGDACTEPLCYTASSLEAERNHLVLHDLSLVDRTHGVVRIHADRAEAVGLDLASSQWILTGHVQVDMDQGAGQHNALHAEAATVRFLNKSVTAMTATGDPADFARTVDGTHEQARGHARTILYDVERNQVQLDGDSWLSDGCREITAPQIDYDVLRQRVHAAAGGDPSQVRGTIRTGPGAQCPPEGSARP
jgi:lipopolysaccharide transport protein LptA